MVLERFFHEKLAQASYLVGDADVEQAIVVDPNRDVDQYIEAASKHGLKIVAVTETHIHADYLSGSRELALKTGAKLYLSDEGDADWRYEFSAEPLKQGDSLRVGAVRLDVLKARGHTPEHIVFLITDEATSPEPMGMFSGDFVFVGDVGRPDLLESAAGIVGSMESSARSLYQSLQAISGLPPHLLLWPGHGAGSACGKALGAVPVSSLGYERMTNWALKNQSEDTFVREVLSGQPEPPLYFAEMKRLNKQGPPILGGFKLPPRLTEPKPGVILVDLREPELYAAGHVPGSLHLPQYKGFIGWAGSILPYDQDLYLLAPDEESALEAVKDLAMIGLDRVTGWYDEDALEKFGPLETTQEVDSGHIPSEAQVVDVRGKGEWDEGHIPSAIRLPLPTLAKAALELPKDRPLAVHCEGGVRSPIAVSLLKHLGFSSVVDISDGYRGYAKRRSEQIAAFH